MQATDFLDAPDAPTPAAAQPPALRATDFLDAPDQKPTAGAPSAENFLDAPDDQDSFGDKVKGAAIRFGVGTAEGMQRVAGNIGQGVAQLSDPGPLKQDFATFQRAQDAALKDVNGPQFDPVSNTSTDPNSFGRAMGNLVNQRELQRQALRAPGESFSDAAKELAGELKWAGDVTPGPKLASTAGNAFGQTAAMLAPAAIPVVGPVTGAVTAGAASTGGTFDQAFQAYKEAGFPPDAAREKARDIALKTGSTTALIFSLPVGELAAMPKSTVARLAAAAGIGGSQMGADTLQSLLQAKASYNPNLTLTDIAKQTGTSAGVGALLSGLMHGYGETVANREQPTANGEQVAQNGEQPGQPAVKTGTIVPPANPTAAPAAINPDMLADLQSALAGNQIKKPAPAAQSTDETEVQPTEASPDAQKALQAVQMPRQAQAHPETGTIVPENTPDPPYIPEGVKPPDDWETVEVARVKDDSEADKLVDENVNDRFYRREGSDFVVYEDRPKSATSAAESMPAPETGTIVPPEAGNIRQDSATAKPSGFQPPEMPQRFDTVQDVLDYRDRYKAAEIDFYKSLGLTDQEAAKFFRSGDNRSNLDTSALEAKMTPENQARLEQFSTGEGSQMYQWDRQYNPSELLHENDPSELARNVVQNVSRESPPTEFGDKLLHASIALRKLKEVGGTWTDIAKQLDKTTTGASSSQGDKEFVFKKWGDQIKQFSAQQGVDLPEGDFAHKPKVLAEPAKGEISDKIIQRNLRAEADPVLDYLNSLKSDTNGKLHAFGLLPEAWNKLVDLVILGLRGGRKVADAVSWAFDRFKQQNPEAQFDEAGARTHFEKTQVGNLRYETPEGEAAPTEQPAAGTEAPPVKTTEAPTAATGYENLKQVAAEKSDTLATTRREIATARENNQPVTRDMLERQRGAKQQDQAARKALNNHPQRAKELIMESVAAAREVEAARQSGDRERMANAQTRFETATAATERIPPALHDRVYNELVKHGELPAMKEFPGTEGGGRPAGPDFAKPLERSPENQAKTGKRFFGLESTRNPRVRDVFDALQLARDRLAAGWRKRPTMAQMTYLWDGAMNRSRAAAREVSNIVLHELNREFGQTDVGARNKVREGALAFATEADGDVSKLAEFREKIMASDDAQSKNGREALAAIDYADKNWDKFNTPNDRRSGLTLVELQQELTAAERGTELNSGLDVPEWQSPYIMHATAPDDNAVLMRQQQGGGITDKFTRKRMNPTLADDVAGGIPLRSLSAIDLLEQRVRYGQENVNAISWMHTLREIQDPTTKQPLVTDTIPRTSADGTSRDDAPPGYSVVNAGRVKFAMLNGYDGVFGDLTKPTWFDNGPGRTVQKFIATSKHIVTLMDTMHFGVEATRKFLLTGNINYKKGVTLLDNTPREIQLMADRGEIPKKWADDLIENKRKLALMTRNGANFQDMSSNLYKGWTEKIPVAGEFNQWLFRQYVRGAMAEAALIRFEKGRQNFPSEPEQVTARREAKAMNGIFGNLQNQGWARSATGQDFMRLAMFAPYWNETLLRTEAGGIGEIAKIPFDSLKQRRLVVGSRAHLALAGTLGGFAVAQIINMATRGKPTWQNQEEGPGAKISAYIPDIVGGGPGFMFNPFALSMKLTHLAMTKIERNWETAQPKTVGQAAGTLARAGGEILQSRLTGPARAAMIPLTRRDQFGRPLRNEEILSAMGNAITPLPISAPAAYQAGKQLVTGQHSESYPGQFQRQVFSSGGVLLDQAPSPSVRIARLARQYNASNGKAPNTGGEPHGDFEGLDGAIERGNETDTQHELQDLLTHRTAEQVSQHYAKWSEYPFTGGSAEHERAFRDQLTPERQRQYDLARDNREKIAAKVEDLLPAAGTASAQ